MSLSICLRARIFLAAPCALTPVLVLSVCWAGDGFLGDVFAEDLGLDLALGLALGLALLVSVLVLSNRFLGFFLLGLALW